jgi:hypothetical membrane protein
LPQLLLARFFPVFPSPSRTLIPGTSSLPTIRIRGGALLFIGTVWFLMGIVVSKAPCPGNRVTQMISDRGAGSTASIVNPAIFGSGLLLIASAYPLHTAATNRWFLVLLAVTGLGAAGVGVFPETIIVPHSICAITVFVCGGLCATFGFRIFTGPWSKFSPVLGIFTLIAVVLLGAKIFLGLGAGGMERMIAYPLIIRAIGTGAYLMAPESG